MIIRVFRAVSKTYDFPFVGNAFMHNSTKVTTFKATATKFGMQYQTVIKVSLQRQTACQFSISSFHNDQGQIISLRQYVSNIATGEQNTLSNMLAKL